MASFLAIFDNFYRLSGHEKENITEYVCTTKVDTSLFHYYLLIPSVMTTLILASSMPRQNKWLTVLGGRPGAVFPMNILGKSHRYMYAAAWGSVAFLTTDLVFGQQYIVKLSGPAYVTVFNTILSIIIVGVDYLPLFASLALESVVGYVIGTIYALMLFAVQIVKDAECHWSAQARLILLFQDIPNLLCLGYLSISLPVKGVQAFRRKTIRLISSSERVSVLTLKKTKEVFSESEHVRNLLRAPLPPIDPPTTKKEQIKTFFKTFVSEWIYQRKPGFLYSARIMSVMLIGLMIVYKVTLEITVTILSYFKVFEYAVRMELDQIGNSDTNETLDVSSLEASYQLIYDVKVCFLVAMAFACAGSVITILHMLSSYRDNLLALYKGDNTHIPPRSTLENAALLVGSIKYAGYQVAYIAWGLVIHLVALFLVALVVCVIVNLIRYGVYQWILTLLSGLWPTVLMTIAFMVTQKLLSQYVFLQESGDVLAIDNRRLLFSFTFFMFFYNIFIGIFSCFMRIMKSVLIGTIFLPRLDNSALPRRFQMFDPGFANYCGFIHVECAHTHPVMLTFLRLLMIASEQSKSRSKSSEMQQVVVDKDDSDNSRSQNKTTAKARAIAKWHLLYTLQNNPTLRLHRKGYLDYMKQMHERLARHCKLNRTAMGNLVKNVNNVLANNDNDKVEIADVSVGMEEEETNAQANWNALLAMNKFLRQIQRDVVKRDTSVKLKKEGNTYNKDEKDIGHVNEIEEDDIGSGFTERNADACENDRVETAVHFKVKANKRKPKSIMSLDGRNTGDQTSES